MNGKNVTCINGDSLKEIEKLKQDIIYADLPWGGTHYKENKKMMLFLGETPLYKICNNVKDKCKYIALKVPTNFDYNLFKENCKLEKKLWKNFDNKFYLLVLIGEKIKKINFLYR